jgi:hypothetical protein
MNSTALIVILLLVAYVVFDNWRWSKRDALHCMRCHTEAQPQAASGMRSLAGLCVVVGLVLALFNWLFLLLSLVALIARAQMPEQKCPACGSAELVPTDSPAAVAAVAAMQAGRQKPQ